VSDLLEGARLHAAGEHWAAHEAWETLWRAETDETRRRFLQGLIQITAAFHKLLVMKRPDGAVRLLGRGLAKLDPLPDDYDGVDLAAFRTDARRCLALIEALDVPESFDRAEIPVLRLVATVRD
jgi:hypothetical protein